MNIQIEAQLQIIRNAFTEICKINNVSLEIEDLENSPYRIDTDIFYLALLRRYTPSEITKEMRTNFKQNIFDFMYAQRDPENTFEESILDIVLTIYNNPTFKYDNKKLRDSVLQDLKSVTTLEDFYTLLSNFSKDNVEDYLIFVKQFWVSYTLFKPVRE